MSENVLPVYSSRSFMRDNFLLFLKCVFYLVYMFFYRFSREQLLENTDTESDNNAYHKPGILYIFK